MKRVVFPLILLVVFLLVFLAVNTPAHWAYSKFVKPQLVNLPIVIGQPKGRILKGKTQIASIPSQMPIQIFVPNLEWEWQPAALLKGQFIIRVNAYAIELAGNGLGDYVADIGLGFGGYIIKVRDNNALLEVNANININQQPRQASGFIKLRKQNTEISNLLNTLSAIKPDGNFHLNF